MKIDPGRRSGLRGTTIDTLLGAISVTPLTSFQSKHLRGLAHGLKPVVFIGQKGITPSVLESIREALSSHELIKVKFLEFKDRESKAQLTVEIERRTDCCRVGLLGHIAIFYRPHPDPEKRKVTLPNPSRPPA